MSWLDSLWDFGEAAAPSVIGAATGTPTTPASSSGGFMNSNFFGGLLNAGVGLAGSYLQASSQKELAEQAAEQRMKELAFAAEQQKKGGGGGGGGGAGAALKIAKMNNLSALYQNYASIMAKAAETESGAALGSGKLITEPLNIRASKL